jgi:hypothetical protein
MTPKAMNYDISFIGLKHLPALLLRGCQGHFINDRHQEDKMPEEPRAKPMRKNTPGGSDFDSMLPTFSFLGDGFRGSQWVL